MSENIEGKRILANNPQIINKILKSVLKSESEHHQNKEHFWVIGVDTKKVIRFLDLVSLGGLNNCPVHPREVFRLAIMKGVDSIILAHNHPSGDSTPSHEDFKLTEKIKECGILLGIEVLDHIIIGENYYSFRRDNENF